MKKGSALQTYTIYERYPASEDIEQRASELVFVKEGFAILAFLVPLIWLLFNRMWWEAGAFFAFVVIFDGVLTLLGVGPEINAAVSLLINVVFAFEARNLRRYALERKGYSMIAIASGHNLDEVEQRFFTEWLPSAKFNYSYMPLPPDRPGMSGMSATAALSASGQGRDFSMQPVIGMFPTQGG
jgi:hypothetical protein